MKPRFAWLSVLISLATVLGAQAPKTHRLEATPATVAYGYYWSEAKPVLRIASGDIIDVDTLLTNSPNGLLRAGVAEDRIQSSLKSIVLPATGADRADISSPVQSSSKAPSPAMRSK